MSWEPWRKIETTAGEQIGCCDCGLTHDIDVRLIDGVLKWRWRRNEKATKDTRKKYKFKITE